MTAYKRVELLIINNIENDELKPISKDDKLSTTEKRALSSIGKKRNYILRSLSSTGSSKTPRPDGSKFSNFTKIIRNDPVIQDNLIKNDFNGSIFFGHNDCIQDNGLSVQKYIEAAYGMTPTKTSMVVDAINDVVKRVKKNHFNPVKQFITHEKWDGRPRIANAFIYFLGADGKGTHGDYNRTVAKKFAIGAVARALSKGPIDMPLVPILSGGQGIGKTAFVEAIGGCPNNYHTFKGVATDTGFESNNNKINGLSTSDTDNVRVFTNSWIFELGELASFGRSKVSNLKDFFSNMTYSIRHLYQDEVHTVPNRNMFIGTTNSTDFLRDATGNRRFFPIKCADKPHDIIHMSSHMSSEYVYQYWAEAYHYYEVYENTLANDKKQGKLGDQLPLAPWLFNTAQLSWINQNIYINFMEYDPVEAKLEGYLRMLVPSTWANDPIQIKHSYFDDYVYNLNKCKRFHKKLHHINFVATAELINMTIGKYDTPMKLSKGNPGRKVNLAMQKLCTKYPWSRGRKRIHGHNVRGWCYHGQHAPHAKSRSIVTLSHKPVKTYLSNNTYYGYLVADENIIGNGYVAVRFLGSRKATIVKHGILVPWSGKVNHQVGHNYRVTIAAELRHLTKPHHIIDEVRNHIYDDSETRDEAIGTVATDLQNRLSSLGVNQQRAKRAYSFVNKTVNEYLSDHQHKADIHFLNDLFNDNNNIVTNRVRHYVLDKNLNERAAFKHITKDLAHDLPLKVSSAAIKEFAKQQGIKITPDKSFYMDVAEHITNQVELFHPNNYGGNNNDLTYIFSLDKNKSKNKVSHKAPSHKPIKDMSQKELRACLHYYTKNPPFK